tara:strand:- start:928 stop:1833 length:906 start_codon:yes stop_codon:yes gene_type:complete
MNEDSNEVIVNEEIKNVSSEDFVREVVEASKEKPIVVDFWAPWCSPCKQLAPILEREVLNANGKISLVKVNIDESQSIAAQLQIQSIPTVYVFYQGQVVDGFQGNIQESEIKSFISKATSLSGPGKEIEELLVILNTCIENNEWERAIDISSEIIDSDKKNIEAHVALIKAYVSLKKFAEAKEFITSIPKDLLSENKINDAIQSIEISEKSFLAVDQLGSLREKVNKNPDDLQLKLDLSIALFGNNQIEESFNLLLSSIQIDRDWNDQASRKQLLEFFQTLGLNSDEVKVARRQLSAILFS